MSDSVKNQRPNFPPRAPSTQKAVICQNAAPAHSYFKVLCLCREVSPTTRST